MSEVTDLVVIEKSNAMAVFTNAEQLDPLIAAIESEARSLVPDITTKKGRDAIASMAHKVARSKTYIDNAGKDLVAELKALPKQIDESRRLVRERLDALKDEVRRPLTEWEAEQERIAAEKAAEEERLRIEAEEKAVLEALKKQFESDHEIALLMNDKFDRDAAEAKAEAERQRIAHEEELKRQAAEKATRDAEEKAERQRVAHESALSEINGIQQQVIIAQSGRLGVRKGGTIECIRETLSETEAWPIDERFGSLIDNAEKTKQQAITQIMAMLESAETIEKQRLEMQAQQEALAKSESDKQKAIDEEQRKAQAEADRIKREADEKETARLAEEKRIADEAAARAANEKHRKVVGTEIVSALLGHTSLSREQAIEVLVVLKDELIPRTRITY